MLRSFVTTTQAQAATATTTPPLVVILKNLTLAYVIIQRPRILHDRQTNYCVHSKPQLRSSRSYMNLLHVANLYSFNTFTLGLSRKISLNIQGNLSS